MTHEISQNQEFFLIGSETMSHLLKKKTLEATGPTEKNSSVTKKQELCSTIHSFNIQIILDYGVVVTGNQQLSSTSKT